MFESNQTVVERAHRKAHFAEDNAECVGNIGLVVDYKNERVAYRDTGTH